MKIRLKILLISIGVVLLSCRNENETAQQFSESYIYLNDQQEVVMSLMDTVMVKDLRSDSISPLQWSNFFAVYPDTADSEMRDFQDPLPGEYVLMDDRLVFKPTQNFVKGQKYFVRCYRPDLLDSAIDLLQSGKLIAASELLSIALLACRNANKFNFSTYQFGKSDFIRTFGTEMRKSPDCVGALFLACAFH